jgi:hypothetical protein
VSDVVDIDCLDKIDVPKCRRGWIGGKVWAGVICMGGVLAIVTANVMIGVGVVCVAIATVGFLECDKAR